MDKEDYATEFFDERVAIMIHDGGLQKNEAIRKAYFCLRNFIGAESELPAAIKQQVKEVQNGTQKAV